MSGTFLKNIRNEEKIVESIISRCQNDQNLYFNIFDRLVECRYCTSFTLKLGKALLSHPEYAQILERLNNNHISSDLNTQLLKFAVRTQHFYIPRKLLHREFVRAILESKHALKKVFKDESNFPFILLKVRAFDPTSVRDLKRIIKAAKISQRKKQLKFHQQLCDIVNTDAKWISAMKSYFQSHPKHSSIFESHGTVPTLPAS